MSREEYVGIALLTMIVVSACAFIALTIGFLKARGDRRSWCTKLLLFWFMGHVAIICCMAVHTFGTLSLIISLPILAVVWVMAVLCMRSLSTESYFRRLYKDDPGFCGRCGYDLTGNVSGRCSECGWKLPRRYRCGRCGYDLTGNLSRRCPECGWKVPRRHR